MSEQARDSNWIPGDSFALRLVMLRAELGLSQEEAAGKCALKPSTWATWEHGSKPRGMDTIVQRISAALGVDRGWLMFGGPLRTSDLREHTSAWFTANQPSLFDEPLAASAAA